MRILLIILLVWLIRKAMTAFKKQYRHRKLVRQLKSMGAYGGGLHLSRKLQQQKEPLVKLSSAGFVREAFPTKMREAFGKERTDVKAYQCHRNIDFVAAGTQAALVLAVALVLETGTGDAAAHWLAAQPGRRAV